MNALEAEPCRWSRRRWIYAVAGVFLVQVGLVMLAGRRSEQPPERPIFRTVIRLAVETGAAAGLAELAAMEDPTLLALPTLQGFSGGAWLEYPQMNDEPEAEPEPSYWLAPTAAQLGSSFAALVATNQASPVLVADRPLPRLPRYEPSAPSEPVAAGSRLQIGGDLAGRPLLVAPELPAWRYSDILSNSVVQTMVNADGVVVFTALVSQSGLKEADARAVELAGSARFRPLSRATAGSKPLTWGRLVFRWQTLPLPVADPARGLLP